MAKLTTTMPEKLALQLSNLGARTDEIINTCLEAAGKEALDVVKSSLSAVVGKGTKLPSKSTGELIGALGVTPPQVDFKGINNVKIGFNEPRRHQNVAKGKRSYNVRTNAMIANVLEHGRHGQTPKPFLKPARSKARKVAISAMQAKFDQEVNKL